MKRLNVLQSLAVLFVLSQISWGAVPQLINFQGVVKDSAGNTPAVDMLGVTFTIYDAPLGGTALWTETQSITIADEGRFNILLGSSNPIPDSVFADTVRWLGIKVETDPEMLPRQQLASVGYAYRVNSIDGALGGTINGAIDAPGMSSKIRFHFNDVSEFPSASTYHGMFAHAHNQGAAYYAHAAQWVRLADSAHPHSSLAASDLSPNPALSVDADGNVGIGTTSPSTKLHIADTGAVELRLSPDANNNSQDTVTIRLTGENFITTEGFAIRYSNGGDTYLDNVWNDGANSNPAIRFRTKTAGTAIDAMTITHGGNVGIGTTSPGAKLSLGTNGANTKLALWDVTGDQYGFGIQSLQFRLHLGNSNARFSFLNASNGSEIMTLQGNGNLGIGTSSPAAKLHINTTVSFTSASFFEATDISAAGGFLRLKDGTITGAHYMPMIHGKGVGTGVDRSGLLLMGEPGEDGSDDGAVVIDGRLNGVSLVNSPILRVRNLTSEKFRISADGNVGIGTTSPGASNLLELASTTKGFVLPRMTKTERDAMASPVAGMMVYQTDNTPGLRVYNGANWMRFTETAD